MRFEAFTAAELLSGPHENVMSDPEGKVVLASGSIMPNPDLSDFDERGRLEFWTLDAPDRPDGYHDYARQLTTISPAGLHVALRDTRLARQNGAKISLERPYRSYPFRISAGAPLPEIGKRARIAPPAGAPRVRVVSANGAEGFPAGRVPLSYAGIVGDNPIQSMRITNAAPVTYLDVSQGNVIDIYLSGIEVPENWTGIAWLAGPPGTGNTQLSIQDRMDIRRGMPNEVRTLTQFRRGRTVVGTTANSTANPSGTHGPPRRFFEPSRLNLKPLKTTLSYRLVFDGGVSASQGELEVEITAERKGEALAWKPPKSVAGKGVRAWIPEFTGDDGNVYTLTSAASGIPLNRAAEIHTNSVNPKNWKGEDKPRKIGRSETDTAAIKGPDVPLQDPVARGAVRAAPGSYSWRQTFAVGGEESGPGPVEVLTLRDAGLAGGGPASGVSDQMFKVYRPTLQTIANARFTERSPNGEIETDWETPAVPGVSVSTLDGVLIVDDTSGAASGADVRISDPIPVDPAKLFPVRFRLEMTRRSGGMVYAMLRFRDANGAIIQSPSVFEKMGTLDTEWVNEIVGPRGSKAGFYFPPGTKTLQLIFHNFGEAGSPRNMAYRVSHIGRALHPKRWPLSEDLSNDRDIEDRRSPATENEKLPYPDGPYCRVVMDPTDGPRSLEGTKLDELDFEGGPSALLPAGFTLVPTNMTATVDPQAAISGLYGLALSKSAGGSGSAYVAKSYAGRTSLGWLAAFRLPEPPATGAQTLLEVRNGAGASLARVTRTALGVLTLFAKNGGGETSVVIASNAYAGNRLRLEIVPTGLGTANGRVELNWSRNGRRMPQGVISSLAWSSETMGEARAGIIGVPSADTCTVHLDDVKATASGEAEGAPLDTNYAEYWAPPGTPYSNENFMSGMRVPVLPERDMVLSAYLGTENVERAASPLVTVFTDEVGNVLARNASLAPNLIGDNPWDRHWLVLHSPPGTAYLQFAGGPVADGLIRAAAFNLTYGTYGTGLLPWTNRNAPSGFFDVTFDTSVPGGSLLWIMDWRERWLRLRAVATQPLDEAGAALTTVSQEIRAASSKAGLATVPWRSSLDELMANEGIQTWAEVRTTLATTDITKSPEVRSVFIEAVGVEPMLLREDGSEFPSGCLIRNMPAPAPPDTDVTTEYADGGVGYEDIGRGDAPETIGPFEIECYRDSAAREIQGLRRVSADVRGKHYLLQLKDKARFSVERRVHEEAPEGYEDGFYIHKTTVSGAYVLMEEDL